MHRLPALRDRLHRRRPRPVQRRHDPPSRGLHRLSAGRAEEGGHRSRRQLALLVRLPGRHPGARLRVPDPQRRVREGLPAGAGGDAPRRHPGAGVLRPVRGRVHPQRAGGNPPDPPPQALRRRLAPRALRRPRRDGGSPEREARRDRRLRPGRPDGGLAACPRRLRRQDLRGGPGARRLPAARDPGLPAADRGRREGHQERHRHRGRARHEHARPRPGRPEGQRLRRRPRGDRDPAVHQPGRPGRGDHGASSAVSSSCTTSASTRRPISRASGSSSSAAGTWRWTPRGPRGAWARRA